MDKVLIFGGARTGTTTLAHCLRHTGFARNKSNMVLDEPLNKPTRKPRIYNNQGLIILTAFQEAKLLHKFIITESPKPNHVVNSLTAGELYRVLDALYAKSSCIKHLHDKILPVNNKILLDYATDNNIKIILQERKDTFSIALSKLMSQQSEQWHTLTDKARKVVDEYEYTAIPICDIQSRMEQLENSQQYSAYMKTKDIDYHTVCYEDFLHPDNDIDHRIKKLKDILSYIGWEYVESDKILQGLSPTTKQYTEGHYNKVPNIEEIYKWRDSLTS